MSSIIIYLIILIIIILFLFLAKSKNHDKEINVNTNIYRIIIGIIGIPFSSIFLLVALSLYNQEKTNSFTIEMLTAISIFIIVFSLYAFFLFQIIDSIKRLYYKHTLYNRGNGNLIIADLYKIKKIHHIGTDPLDNTYFYRVIASYKNESTQKIYYFKSDYLLSYPNKVGNKIKVYVSKSFKKYYIDLSN